MAQHGYLREYDEGWDRSDERSRWRGDDDRNERNLNFMLGDRERGWDRNQGPDRERERAQREFRSLQDEHYRRWRDNQMRALDRDYEDYCREREQQFHKDFDSWRQNRQQQPSSSEPVLELNNPTGEMQRSPMADATLGTNNSENNVTSGRTRR